MFEQPGSWLRIPYSGEPPYKALCLPVSWPRMRVRAICLLLQDLNLVWSPYCDKISFDDLTRSVQMVQRNEMAWLDILDECHNDKIFHLCGYGDARCDTGEFSSTWKHHLTKMQVFWTESHHTVLWNLQR